MQANKIDVGKLFLYVLVAVLFLGVITQPTNATKGTRPAVDRVQLLGPTPITTPSSLDALSLTSDLAVGGNGTVAGTLGVTGVTTTGGIVNSGGTTNTNYWSVSAPTAIASATPAARINSLGANNDLLVVEKASTPVFKVGNGGAVTMTGNLTVSGVISQGASAQKCITGQQSYIGSATVIPATLTAAGITTPFPAIGSINQGPNNNVNLLSSTSTSGVVTLNAWQAILGATLTPVASTTTVAETYTICGQ